MSLAFVGTGNRPHPAARGLHCVSRRAHCDEGGGRVGQRGLEWKRVELVRLTGPWSATLNFVQVLPGRVGHDGEDGAYRV